MRSDRRLALYREAVAGMRQGRFRFELPSEGDDELGRLGKELQELAAALERRFDEYRRLAEITERVNAGLLLDEVLDFVFESFRPLIPYDRIGLALLEDDGSTVRARWARSDAPSLRISSGYAAPLAGSSLEPLLESGRPRIINNLQRYLEDHPGSDSTRRIVGEGMRSSLTCPLVALSKPIGFLFFSSMDPDTYRDIHEDLFLQIAGQLSLIVDKSRIYQEVLQLNQQLREARRQLEIEATHDPLTGIWNRGAILAILNKELARAKRWGQALTVVLADIDRFKELNDRAGHQAGDRALQQAARIMSESLRASESLGRYGGEEFLMVLYPAGENEAQRVLERIQAAVRELVVDTGADPGSMTISQGAAVCRHAGDLEVEDLIRAADQALYRAKEAGRDRYEVAFLPQAPT